MAQDAPKINLAEVNAFDKNKLTHQKAPATDCAKAPLVHEVAMKNIETFKKEGLKKSEVNEKSTLPTKEDIEKEKEAMKKSEF